MRKKFTILLALPILLFGCGEAGVESDVSKITEVSFTVTSNDIMILGTFPGVNLFQTVDPTSEDFAEYRNDVENYFINKIEVQISDYTPTGMRPGLLLFNLGVNSGNNIISDESLLADLTDSNGKLDNSEKVVIFDRKDEGNGIIQSNNTGIQELLSALDGQNEFSAQLQVVFDQEPTSNFTITLFLDLTARVQLEN